GLKPGDSWAEHGAPARQTRVGCDRLTRSVGAWGAPPLHRRRFPQALQERTPLPHPPGRAALPTTHGRALPPARSQTHPPPPTRLPPTVPQRPSLPDSPHSLPLIPPGIVRQRPLLFTSCVYLLAVTLAVNVPYTASQHAPEPRSVFGAYRIRKTVAIVSVHT